jgi:ABC-type Mn2+/Zn2+ transport system ATPase subunit
MTASEGWKGKSPTTLLAFVHVLVATTGNEAPRNVSTILRLSSRGIHERFVVCTASSEIGNTCLEATQGADCRTCLSAGQQQLLCLARVLLRRPMVVCLDECTANVDPNTAAVMQELIESQLERSTVIQVLAPPFNELRNRPETFYSAQGCVYNHPSSCNVHHAQPRLPMYLHP